MQAGFVNFYAEDAVNPYVALAARGPWVVTLKGAVLHDSGGYGMLGFGHTPEAVLDAMAKPQVMANIMTPSLSQLRFDRALRKRDRPHARRLPVREVPVPELGLRSRCRWPRASPTSTPSCMTDPGARHAGRTIKRLVVKGASTAAPSARRCIRIPRRKTYVQHLASFRGEDSRDHGRALRHRRS